MKVIFVVGGVCSGIGKGITVSSIGRILKGYGNLEITALKIDPYLNSSAGTISPLDHGEVFVTRDGAETDLDLGNYERFLDISLSKENSITTGKIYKSIADKENKHYFGGKTIQQIPHVRDEIIEHIENCANSPITSTLLLKVIVVNLTPDSLSPLDSSCCSSMKFL